MAHARLGVDDETGTQRGIASYETIPSPQVTSPAVLSWLKEMQAYERAPKAWDVFARYFEQMPLDLLRLVGEQLTPVQRGKLSRVRERRRCFAKSTAPRKLSAEVQRLAQPQLWHNLVARAEGEQDEEDGDTMEVERECESDDHDRSDSIREGNDHMVGANKGQTKNNMQGQERNAQKEQDDDINTAKRTTEPMDFLHTGGPLGALHAKYLAAMEQDVPPIDAATPRELVESFQDVILAQFVMGRVRTSRSTSANLTTARRRIVSVCMRF